MKKILYIVLIGIILLGLFGCSGDNEEHIGEAKTPSGSSVQKGKDYLEVLEAFEEKGFRNIKFEIMDDLITGWLTKGGEVESVSVDGNLNYSPDEWYSEDVEVVIAYHTFPNEEYQDFKQEDTENNTNNEKSLNGFDFDTNQTINWYGVDFSVPEYFNVKDDNSQDNSMMYYPEEEDYYASLLFQSQEFNDTDDNFKIAIESYINSLLESTKFKNAEILYSNSTYIAGLSSWILSFNMLDKNGDAINSATSSYIYNKNLEKILIVTCMYDSIDQSNFDYLDDFDSTLITAVATNENQLESIYEKGYKVNFQEYDQCYLFDEDAKTIVYFTTVDYYTSTYKYTGDFNNGIIWNADGLKMKAHYHYVDNDSTLIITDANGITNKAINFGVSTIEGYLKKYGHSN